jgi:hypothetical protein
MFQTMRPLAYDAAIFARFGPAALGVARKSRKTRDIVNFMNFTSGQIVRTRAGAID